MTDITPQLIADLRGALNELPEKENTRLSTRRSVELLADEFAAARRQGYTLSDLSQLLEARGITISASTLGSYLRAARASNAAEVARDTPSVSSDPRDDTSAKT